MGNFSKKVIAALLILGGCFSSQECRAVWVQAGIYPPPLEQHALEELAKQGTVQNQVAWLIRVIDDQSNSNRVAAMFLLSKFKPEFAALPLINTIDFTYTPSAEQFKGVILSPARDALITMGDPVIPYIMAYLGTSTDRKKARACVEVVLALKNDAEIKKMLESNKYSAKAVNCFSENWYRW